MEVRERSPWALAMMGATVLLLIAGLLTPWYSFHHSSGQQNAPGAEPTGDGGVERRDIEYRPFSVGGDASAEQRAEAERPTLVLGVLVSVALLLAVGTLVMETIWGTREFSRIVHLVTIATCFLVCVAALLYVWFVFPALLNEEGVTRVFTTRNDQGTFIRTTLSWGWTAAAVSLLFQVAAFAFKYAGGTFSLTVLEEYRSEGSR